MISLLFYYLQMIIQSVKVVSFCKALMKLQSVLWMYKKKVRHRYLMIGIARIVETFLITQHITLPINTDLYTGYQVKYLTLRNWLTMNDYEVRRTKIETYWGGKGACDRCIFHNANGIGCSRPNLHSFNCVEHPPWSSNADIKHHIWQLHHRVTGEVIIPEDLVSHESTK